MRSQGFAYAVLAGAIVSGCASAPSTTAVPLTTNAAPTVAPQPAGKPTDPEAEARWQMYRKEEQRMYLLDQQKFGSVSCKLDATSLDGLVKMVHDVIGPAADKVTVKDTLADYSLSYSPTSLLHINDPTLQISPKPGVTLTDQAKFDDGSKKISTAFNSLVSGLDTELSALFSMMESSRQPDYDIVYINETPGGFHVSSIDHKSGAPTTLELDGHTLTTKSGVGTSNSVTSVIQFNALPSGKLLVNEITVDIAQTGSLIHAEAVPTFQKLGDLEFPRHLSVKGTIDALQLSHQDVTMEIDLNDCTVH